MIEVTLSPADCSWAEKVGQARIALAPGNPRFAYVERSGRDTHTIGAYGELAAARALGLPWPARVNTFRSLPDLDPFWEVRWSSSQKKIKVATDDPPEAMVLHVTGDPPMFVVHGYILAGWAQQNVPLEDPGSRGWTAHFVSIYRISPVDPGFHELCAWGRHPKTNEWVCFYCGKEFEDGLQVAAG